LERITILLCFFDLGRDEVLERDAAQQLRFSVVFFSFLQIFSKTLKHFQIPLNIFMHHFKFFNYFQKYFQIPLNITKLRSMVKY
jgi:hypothetical protein